MSQNNLRFCMGVKVGSQPRQRSDLDAHAIYNSDCSGVEFWRWWNKAVSPGNDLYGSPEVLLCSFQVDRLQVTGRATRRVCLPIWQEHFPCARSGADGPDCTLCCLRPIAPPQCLTHNFHMYGKLLVSCFWKPFGSRSAWPVGGHRMLQAC